MRYYVALLLLIVGGVAICQELDKIVVDGDEQPTEPLSPSPDPNGQSVSMIQYLWCKIKNLFNSITCAGSTNNLTDAMENKTLKTSLHGEEPSSFE